jgi:cellobiose phosphorylase
VSQTGGGYSFIGGPGYDRITRAGPDIAAADHPGRYVFVRDNASGEYFNIGWQPVKHPPDWFECRHAPGITTIASTNLGITGRITFFVPLNDNLEIWRVSIENTRKEPADLSVFTYVEWVLGNFKDDIERRQQANIFNHVAFHDNYIIATKRLWRRPDSASIVLRETRPAGGVKALSEILSSNQSWGKWAFIALTRPVDGFDCDKEAFIGRYGDLEHPHVVAEGKCTNSDGFGRDAVGVLQTRITIPPGEHIEMAVIVGITIHEGDPSGIVARYSEPGEIDSKLDAIVKYWDSYLTKATANTPDDNLDRAFNVWDKYQSGCRRVYRESHRFIGAVLRL